MAELPRTNRGISPDFKSPASYFDLWPEASPTIEDIGDLHRKISGFAATQNEANFKFKVVWRGVVNAKFGLHSSLYRSLLDREGINTLELPEEQKQPNFKFPDESAMVDAEKEILTFARRDWRMDNLSALEVFARIQHVGGPTRLIDVTMNPYIAAWFATQRSDWDAEDARLFAIAVPSTATGDKSPSKYETFKLDEMGGSWRPFWHTLKDDKERAEKDWGTGSSRRLWVPPHYDPRILAQNAGFIFDGVPLRRQFTKESRQPSFKKPGQSSYWKFNDLLASGSIYAKTASAGRAAQENKYRFSPTFSFRINQSAKKEIREKLEDLFGYSYHSLYPDVQGLSDYVKDHFDPKKS